MIKRLFIIVLFVQLSDSIKAERSPIDSLKTIISSNSESTKRLNALYEILNYLPLNECELYNDQLLTLSENYLHHLNTHSKKYKKYAAYRTESYYNKGVFLSNRNELDSAIIYYKKCLNSTLLIKNEEMDAYCYINMAIIFTTKAQFSKAIDLLYKALAIHEKNKNFEGIGDTYMHIGRVYHAQKEYNKATQFMYKAYIAFKKANYNIGLLESLYKLAQIKTDLHQFKEAMFFLKKSIQFSTDLKIKDQEKQLQLLYSCKGYIAFQKKETDSVIFYMKKSIDIAKINKNTYLLGNRHLMLCRAYFKQKKYEQALNYGLLGLSIADETNDLDLQWNLTKLLTQIYEAKKSYKLAFDMQTKFVKIDGTIKNKKDKKHVLEQQIKHEFDKKTLLNKAKHEKEIAALVFTTEKNNLKKNIGISLLLICIASISIISYLMYRHKQQKLIIERQKSNLIKQKMLLSQMNPHFIFNSINSIQNYVLQNKGMEAYSYLAKFSKLIRMVLTNSTKDQIFLYEEIDLLKTYVEIEQLRFENAFNFTLNVDDEINEQEFTLPPMLVQPFIENAIWHGIINNEKEREGQLMLSFNLENKVLKITIEDNGIGRKQSLLNKKNDHVPLALHITEQRLSLLQELTQKSEIKIQIFDLHDENNIANGTRVEISIPERINS